MIIGKKDRFAIEIEITHIFNSGQALGFLVLHVGGREYGVRARDATVLDFPMGHISDRLKRRGQHLAPFGGISEKEELVEALLGAQFGNPDPEFTFCGFTQNELDWQIGKARLDWSPDGDEAFDDGSHIYQFDVEDRVRLVACRNCRERSISEIWLPDCEFYEILEKWCFEFPVMRRREI